MQLRDLRAYCLSRNFSAVTEYVDSGYSGAKDSRPELNRLMTMRESESLAPCWSGGLSTTSSPKIVQRTDSSTVRCVMSWQCAGRTRINGSSASSVLCLPMFRCHPIEGMSPISGMGQHRAPSLLFPMEAVFEAYVEKHSARQLQDGYVLKAQASGQHLVTHETQRWFRLKPDLLVKDKSEAQLVLDTKWKLLDVTKNSAREKYQLNQAHFYQLYAYGQHYLDGHGDVVLIYPKTDAFTQPLPVFGFPKANGMRLWVLPFCLKERRLMLPASPQLRAMFSLDVSDVAHALDLKEIKLPFHRQRGGDECGDQTNRYTIRKTWVARLPTILIW
jgi:hypothetical protein